MGESSKFSKSWTKENYNLKSAVCLQNIKNSKLNSQLPLDKLKLNQKSYYYLQNSAFWGWLSMESQLQNPELKNNPENFLPLLVHFFLKWITERSLKAPFGVAAVDILKLTAFWETQ